VLLGIVIADTFKSGMLGAASANVNVKIEDMLVPDVNCDIML